MNPNLITLTSDFGLSDAFVGVMKGVVLSLNPNTRLVDLCHSIPPGNIRHGAFVLLASTRFFPPGSVHLAIVDPGVGSGRRPICVQSPSHVFIGPDNGLLSWAAHRQGPVRVFEITRSDLFLAHVSSTFHGRDLFAPVAARVAAGMDPASLGPEIHDMIQLPWPEVKSTPTGELLAEIIYVDRFGNLITNLAPESLAHFGSTPSVRAGKLLIPGLSPAYAAVLPDQPLALIGSAGFLEIAVNGGRACDIAGLVVGDVVTFSREGRP